MSTANTAANELSADGQTDYGVGGHRYNDDLLLSAEARDRARQEHEAVSPTLPDTTPVEEVCARTPACWAATSAHAHSKTVRPRARRRATRRD
jgi:hypothetical protein